MTPTIKLTDPPDPAAKTAAGQALYSYNIAQTGIEDRQPIACVATDPQPARLISGTVSAKSMNELCSNANVITASTIVVTDVVSWSAAKRLPVPPRHAARAGMMSARTRGRMC